MYREITTSSWGKHKFSYGWSETAGFLTKEFIKEYKQLCENSKNNKIKNNSVIYQTPISNYPVYKLKNYIQENKLDIKKARKWSKIDTIIIDKDILNDFEVAENKKFTIIPSKEILSNKKLVNDDDYNYKRSDGFKNVKFFYIGELVSKKDEFKQYSNYEKIEGIEVRRYHGSKKICDNIDFILELFENIKKYNINVVLDSSIDKEINKDTVIDIDIYENLYNMLNSTDKDNWKLAREIVANCEYNKSRPYILFLASVFNTLLNKSDNKNYHTVHKRLNSEKKYFNIWDYKVNEHYHVITNILLKCPEYKSVFSQCLKIHLNNLYKTELVKEIISF